MADRSYTLLLILFFLSLFLHSTFSRSLTHTTNLLDVAASTQRTLDLLSYNSQSSHNLEEMKPVVTSSSLSFSLHPRSSVHKPLHGDYAQLTKSRLDRDSSRVKSLYNKIELILAGVNRSELKPAVSSELLRPEALETPITSGVIQGSGEYFSRVGFGQPARDYYMVIDTGSDISWLQCKPCYDCYQQTDPVFDPTASSSYRSISCGSTQCSALQVSGCRAGVCQYQVSYGDGSYTVGDFATETMMFGNSGTVPNVAIGCGHNNEGLFIGAAGLLGLGGGSLSLPSQLRANSFSYCLVDRDSRDASTLEFNSSPPGDSVFAPLLQNSRVHTYMYVGLTGISVGGHMVDISPSVFAVDESGSGGIIVDCGTAVTRLQTQAYNMVRDSFRSLTQNLPSSAGFVIFDTCYDLSSMTTVSVPTVAFHFGNGRTLPLRAANYLIPVDSGGKYCLAFAPTDSSPSIIGNIQQQGTRVSYDLANSVVGFSSNKC
ncbi:protein ASPARTIC PROTEASE IN GUARD CELL 1-like [Impatiens glandulifera]|uniref:protein ASPARTIC PROTEASE IN GUARD CELL 1-like n=1 Tax=Impatiens glandulifera TaxID=253017 RepID=UPI001FB18447|nr:protein ASPARTIC PROTEASE IN GUARD CELL 1-like [Impatiens glandulifera]